MITEKSDWVPLTTAATRLGCTVKDIHELLLNHARRKALIESQATSNEVTS